MRLGFRRKSRSTALAATLGAVALAACAAVVPLGGGSATAAGPSTVGGLASGAIKHVWLIILENKSYDETFTGLNYNSYLWQTLPSEGALLQNYYGTGHTSMDNYISLVSGQGPEFDTQNDCSYEAGPFSSNSGIVTTGCGGLGLAQLELRAGRVAPGSECSTGSAYSSTSSRAPRPGGAHRHAEHQRLRVPDPGAHVVRPVQRRRRELEGLRPGPGRCAAHRLAVLRQRQRARA